LGAKQHGDLWTNYVKIGSLSCSPQLLEAMAKSEIDRIRLRVAENPKTPVDILELLVSDKSPDVRVAVGTNPSTPAHISYRLAFDEDLNVRLGLADDLNTPIELLEKLMNDANPYVSIRAAQTKEIALSQGKLRSLGKKFMRWFKEGLTELKYA
jgi:hypothetical protein